MHLALRPSGGSIACTPRCIQCWSQQWSLSPRQPSPSPAVVRQAVTLGGGMAQPRSTPAFRAIGLVFFLTTIAGTSIAHAQATTIAGTVVDAKSGLPLADASIAVEGSTPVARSGTRGEFRLINVPGNTARLRATRIGYQLATVDAQVGAQTVRIENDGAGHQARRGCHHRNRRGITDAVARQLPSATSTYPRPSRSPENRRSSRTWSPPACRACASCARVATSAAVERHAFVARAA